MAKKSKKPMKRFELGMKEEVIEKLDDLAEKEDISRAEVIRRCINYGLEHRNEFIEWRFKKIRDRIESKSQ